MIEARMNNQIVVQIKKPKNYQRNLNKTSDQINYIPQVSINVQNSQQNFYKTVIKTADQRLVLIHGFRLLQLSSFDEDILLYCLSLLQSESQYPVKFNVRTKSRNLHQRSAQLEKTVWLQTQIVLSSSTVEEQQQINFNNIEMKMYNFFNQFLVPAVQKFKEKNITWENIYSDDFQQRQLVNNFRLDVINNSNMCFKTIYSDP